MDKLKSIFNPGAKADEDVLYGEGNSNNLGKVAGEGSHFGHSRTTDPSGASPDPASTPAANPAVDASNTATSNASAQQPTPSSTIQTPSSDAAKAAQVASKPQTQDTQSQARAEPQDPQTTTAGLAASRAEANRQESTLPDRSVGGAGKPSSQSQQTHPIYDEFTHDGTNPYSSQTTDPRVDPSAKSQPKTIHTGRDVALGGASAGAAAYEGNKSQNEHQTFNQASAQPSQSTTAPAATSSKPTTSTSSQPAASQPAATTSASRDFQSAPSASTSQPQALAPSTSQASQQSKPAGTGYYVAPHGTAVSNEGPTNQHSNLGRDAAIGAGAGAVGIGGYEASKHRDPVDQARSTTPGSNIQHTGAAPTGYDAQRVPGATANQPASSTPSTSHTSRQPQPTTSGYYTQPSTQSQAQPSEHHYGRDAAAAAGTGAAGVGGYEALKHHENKAQATPDAPSSYQQTSQTSQAPTGYYGQRAPDNTANQPVYSTPSTSHASQQPQPAASGYTGPPNTQSPAQPTQHHYGRDAAAAAGTGAAGVGGYEALKQHEDKSQASPSVPSNYQQTQASQAPHVQSGVVPGQAITTDSRQPAPVSEPQRGVEHHYGRDAAVGAGAGAAGIGGYEALKHHQDKSLPSGVGSTSQQSARAAEPTTGQTTEPSQAFPTATQEQKPSEHHYGRDAAIGAGAVGAGGAAAYEAKKHEELKEQQRQQEEASAAEKAHEKELKKQEKQHEKEVKKEEKQHAKEIKKEEKQHEKEAKAAEAEQEKQAKKEAKEHDKAVKAAEAEQEKQAKQEAKEHEKLLEEDRKRREKGAATAAAGIGAAGLGAEEHERRKSKDSDDDKGDGKKKGGLLGLFHRDKKDKDTEDEHHDSRHHRGEEAAAGAGAVGAAGLGKHEVDKHKENEQTPPTGSTATDSDDGKKKGGLLGGLLGRNKKDKDSADEKSDEHHYGRDAALGAGAVGAGTLGKHEYDEHKDRQPKATAGNIQDSGTPRAAQDTQHQGPHRGEEAAAGAAAGAGVLGAGALGKHEYDNHHQTPQDPRTAQATSTVQPPGSQTQRGVPTQDDPQRPQHHYKEEAAAGAGLAGTGLLSKHEYDKHRQQAPQDTTTAGPATTSQPTQQLTSKNETRHPHRKEEAAAAAGAVGAGAVGKHELDKHNHPTEGQDLGVSQGQVHEHYRHPKTEADIAAEKRNEIPVLGQFHREGHLHGKEGGAPGAVGVPPEERDQGYIESQKQAHTEHKKPGLLDKILHRHPKDDTTEASESEHEGRNRLHKDPPEDHPAANITIDPTTGLPMDTSKGPHTGAGTDGLPHGHHSEHLPDNRDVNVQHPEHDSARMGYGADASGRYNV